MSKQKIISDITSRAAYMKAYANGPDWDTVLPPNVTNILHQQAVALETSLTCVVANILASLSAVLGPGTKIKISDGYFVSSSIYQLFIASSGSGKSHTYDYLFLKPLRQLQKEKQIQFLVEEFTPAGLLNFLCGNSGFAVFASDEFAQHMQPKFASKRDDNQALRSHLNKFYNGSGFNKSFATKPSLEIESVYLTIFGLSQPQPYALMQHDLASTSDGLAQRFMILCGSPIPEEPEEGQDEDPNTKEDENQPRPSHRHQHQMIPHGTVLSEIIVMYLLSIYEFHHTLDQPITYEFDKEAAEYLDHIKRLAREAKKTVHKDAISKIRDGTASFSDIPDDDTSEKDREYIAKYSVLIHVISTTLENAIEKKFAEITVSNKIPRDIVEKAHHLVSSMRAHQREFRNVYQELPTPVEEAAQTTHILQGQLDSLERKILLFPVKAVSSMMLIRKHRNIHSRSMDLPNVMKDLSKDPTANGYVGQYQLVGKNIHVFFKTAPEKIDKNELKTYNITEEQYSKYYHSDTTKPPVSGFSNWTSYYASIISAAPEDL